MERWGNKIEYCEINRLEKESRIGRMIAKDRHGYKAECCERNKDGKGMDGKRVETEVATNSRIQNTIS